MHILRHLNIRNVRRKKTSVLNIDNGTKKTAKMEKEFGKEGKKKSSATKNR